MRFEWHEAKNRLNRRKHRVSFERARRVFEDPFALMLLDETVAGEERCRAIGRASVDLVVAHTVKRAGSAGADPHHLGPPGPYARATPI